MVNFLELGKKDTKKKIDNKPKKPKRDYGLSEDGTKTCDKCKKPFVPNKFTPYQKTCQSCGKGGDNAPRGQKTSGGGLIRTQCNKCGKSIRIDPSIMTALCDEHCLPTELESRKQMVVDTVDRAISNEYDILHTLVSGEIAEYRNVIIEKYSNGDLAEYPFTRELLYMFLLAKGFRLSKSGILYKEYNTKHGVFMVSMVSPGMGFFGFCVSYPATEKVGKSVMKKKESTILRTPNFKRVQDAPDELQQDIYPILELNQSFLAAKKVKVDD